MSDIYNIGIIVYILDNSSKGYINFLGVLFVSNGYIYTPNTGFVSDNSPILDSCVE